jgi:hypothetical protein
MSHDRATPLQQPGRKHWTDYGNRQFPQRNSRGTMVSLLQSGIKIRLGLETKYSIWHYKLGKEVAAQERTWTVRSDRETFILDPLKIPICYDRLMLAETFGTNIQACPPR